MLGYENYKGDESEVVQFQGIPGAMPGYTFTPQHMSMPGQHWGMMMNNPGGRLPTSLPPPHHPQHPLTGHHPPLPPFQPLPMVTSIDPSQSSGTYLDMNIPSPTESDTSSTGSSRSNRNRPSYSQAPVSPPPSRERFSYTRYQLELLNGIYTKIRYPNTMQKQLVAKRVGITRDQVKVWFQNRRRKDITGRKQTDVESSSPKMVPVSVLSGVLNELLSFENEPRGKKAVTAQKSYEKKVAVRRTRENSESSVDEVPQPKAKRQKVASSEDSCTGFPDSYTTGVPEPYTGMPNVHGNQPTSFPTDSLPAVHFANEPSPGNSVGFDSFSSNSHSPFSSASHHDSDITPVNSANNSLVNACQSGDSALTNNAIELALHNNFRTISSEELDRPAPPNVIVPGIDISLLPRPRSLESPATVPYIPVSGSTTDDGLQINPINTIHNSNLHTSSISTDPNSTNLQSNQNSLHVISTNDIQTNSSNNELNVSTENEVHLTTSSDGGLHVTKISSDKQNTSSPSKTKENSPTRNIEIAPNVVAPPSEPLNFDPKIVSTESLKPTPVPVSVAKAEAKARELERLRSANNNNSIVTSNSTDLLNITPLYTMNEVPNSGQPSIQNGIQVEPPMYLPNYPYSAHPGLYPDAVSSSTMASPNLNFDKMMPYMMGCMPGFPAPPDPSFNGKHSNNNNPAGIFKDVYPPSFLLPPYGISGNGGVPYPTYEMPTDLSGGKKSYL